MQCIWNYWHQTERKIHGAVLTLIDTRPQQVQTISNLEASKTDLMQATVESKDESLIEEGGDVQIVTFNHEKPPQFTALKNPPAEILPIPFHRTNLLDVISEENSDNESYTNELPPYSLVENSITTTSINTGGVDTTDRNYFSRYRYETFNDKTFSRSEVDFTKFRKAMREVLPVKDTKTSLRRKRFTQSKLFRGPLQGHS